MGFLGFTATFLGSLFSDDAPKFDYYVLALSWSPSFCERVQYDAIQCEEAGRTFVTHGLWPQYEEGWPEYCDTAARDPSRNETRAETDLFGSGDAAWYQWKKHGRCSGLEPEDYFAANRKAYEAFTIPPVLEKLTKDIRIDPGVVEEAVLEVNPQLSADQVTITCKSNMIAEVRLCLTKDLEPRRCGDDVIRDCTQSGVRMPGISH